MPAFLRRMSGYALVGISTFFLDLGIMFILTRLGLTEYFAIVIAFVTAVSVNFIFSYRYVFTGTTRRQSTGYVFFLLIALIGFLVIAPGSLFLTRQFGVSLYEARIIMALLTGGTNFMLNNFLNFKMGLR